MSINTTPNLHLPQWTSDEKPSWLTEMNQAFSSIDMGFAENKNANASTQSDLEQVKTNALALESRVSANEQGLVGTGNSIDAINTRIANMLQLKSASLTFTPNNGTANISNAQLSFNPFVANLGLTLTVDSNTSYTTVTGTVQGLPEGISGTLRAVSNATIESTNQSLRSCMFIAVNTDAKTFTLYINKPSAFGDPGIPITFSGAMPVVVTTAAIARSIGSQVPENVLSVKTEVFFDIPASA